MPELLFICVYHPPEGIAPPDQTEVTCRKYEELGPGINTEVN